MEQSFRIMTYDERELLKNENYEKNIDIAHYHRFLEGYGVVGCDGVERIAKDVIPTLKEYISWKQLYPGWSYDKMSRTHAAWKNEYFARIHPMNLWIDKMEKYRSNSRARS